jgi:hypothetical protein
VGVSVILCKILPRNSAEVKVESAQAMRVEFREKCAGDSEGTNATYFGGFAENPPVKVNVVTDPIAAWREALSHRGTRWAVCEVLGKDSMYKYRSKGHRLLGMVSLGERLSCVCKPSQFNDVTFYVSGFSV